jgi:hypothetical protein
VRRRELGLALITAFPHRFFASPIEREGVRGHLRESSRTDLAGSGNWRYTTGGLVRSSAGAAVNSQQGAWLQWTAGAGTPNQMEIYVEEGR